MARGLGPVSLLLPALVIVDDFHVCLNNAHHDNTQNVVIAVVGFVGMINILEVTAHFNPYVSPSQIACTTDAFRAFLD